MAMLPEGWIRTTLGKVAKLTMGQSPLSDTYNTESHGLPFFQGKADFGSRYPRIRYWCSEPTKVASEQSILFSVRAPVGEVNITPYECCIGRGLAGVFGETADQEFLFQKLQYAKPRFQLLSQGSTFEAVNGSDLKEFDLTLPPLPEQQKIATILSSVDDVIEKTRAQIDKLKDLKTGMMQELLTKGIGHTEFKDSPVGRIPRTWDVGAIDSFGVDILDGDRGNEYPKEKDFYPFEHCLFLSAKNVTKKGFAFTTLSFITKEKDELLRKGKLTRGDIVITTRGTVGNIAFYDDEVPFDHIRINSGMAIIRNKSEALDSQFLHLLMNSPMVSEQVELLAFGSAQPQLTIGIIKGLNIPKPSIDEQKAIASAVSSATKKLQLATKKLALLESTKKALMQDLLTGKVRVKLQKDMLKNVE